MAAVVSAAVPSILLCFSSFAARFTLARPDSLNSLTFAIYARLRDLFAELESEPSVKVVVITGEGDKGFCSGGDVHDIIGKLLSYGAVDMTAFARMTGDVIRNSDRKSLHVSIGGGGSGWAPLGHTGAGRRECHSGNLWEGPR